jgi:hypothetical protein
MVVPEAFARRTVVAACRSMAGRHGSSDAPDIVGAIMPRRSARAGARTVWTGLARQGDCKEEKAWPDIPEFLCQIGVLFLHLDIRQ